ncbi:MAG: MFS transporter [Hyphomicrobiaceae bacterium]
MSVAVLLAGNGLQITLVPIRANLENFAAVEIGLLGTAYFVGFTIGCVHGPMLVRRAGHIRTFLAMTSLASAVPVLHAMSSEPVLWWVLRAFSGYCFAVLYIVIESWLNAEADNESRGAVFSVYIMINLAFLTAGQMMIGFAQLDSFALFGLASILVSLAAIPVAFTKSSTPTPADVVRPRVRRLYAISPVGVGGCFAVGLANGSFWTLGPVFAQNLGMDAANVGLYMSAVVIGGALGQWPLGAISDRMDRRYVMIAAALVAISAAIATILIPADDHMAIMIAGVFFGLGSFPLYPLAVAHANDVAEPRDYVEVSSGLLLIYSLGAAAGPLLPSIWKYYAGMPTLYMFTAAIHVLLIAYVIQRIMRRPALAEDRVVFSEAAIAAQTVTNFDPLGVSATEEAIEGSASAQATAKQAG